MAGPAVPRPTLKVRTECVSSARSDLCGGRGVISVPTAIDGSNSEVLTPFCWPESKILPAQWLADEEPRAVEDPTHVEKSFVRKLGDLIRVRRGTPDRLMQATAER